MPGAEFGPPESCRYYGSWCVNIHSTPWSRYMVDKGNVANEDVETVPSGHLSSKYFESGLTTLSILRPFYLLPSSFTQWEGYDSMDCHQPWNMRASRNSWYILVFRLLYHMRLFGTIKGRLGICLCHNLITTTSQNVFCVCLVRVT